ncbi:MAG: hypothetical protein LBD34_01820 [Puniceicoccales bacterium]|nr:hypothetical protein [Puniceicoccales bacterium]
MESLKRTQFAQGYDLLVAKPVGKGNSAPKVEDPIVAGGKEVTIHLHKVPDTPLRTRSVVAAAVPLPPFVPRHLGIYHSASWLWFTAENTANLPQSAIVKSLYFKGRFDPSKLAMILLLQDGEVIANQLLDGIPGNRLLELLGGNRNSMEEFVYYMLFGKYFKRIMEESPTLEEAKDRIRVECEFYPKDLQRRKLNKLITAPAQAMMELWTDKDKRMEFENQLRKIVDLILGKLPPPNEENRRYWNNVCEAIKDGVGESPKEKDRKRLMELREKFPAFKAAMETKS